MQNAELQGQKGEEEKSNGNVPIASDDPFVDSLYAMVRVLHDSPDPNAPETRRALKRIAAAANDPARMQSLLNGEPEEEEGPVAERDGVAYARDGTPLTPGVEKSSGGPTMPEPKRLDHPDVRALLEKLFTTLDIPEDEIEPAIEEAKTMLEEERGGATVPGGTVDHPDKARFLALAMRAEKDGDKASAKLYRRQAAELKGKRDYSISAE